MSSTVFLTTADLQNSIESLLDKSDLLETIGSQNVIILKPNLVEALQPPITTPVEVVSKVIQYLQKKCPDKNLIVAEGSGSVEYETWHTFDALGYSKMANELNVALMDLNTEPLTCQEKSQCNRWPQMYLPDIIFDSFLLSIPVLKAHSLAGVTLTMKNMMGVCPPEHYQQGGHWKKASFHHNIQEAVFDLNQYRTPDFTILDATVGMQEAHLWGPTCSPPHNKFAASSDSVAIDAFGTKLLKRNWQQIGHIQMANGVLGDAQSYQLIEV